MIDLRINSDYISDDKFSLIGATAFPKEILDLVYQAWWFLRWWPNHICDFLKCL